MKAPAIQSPQSLVAAIRRKRNNLHLTNKGLWQKVFPQGVPTLRSFENLLYRKEIKQMDSQIYLALNQWVNRKS